ncbi:MAG TPA: Gfo/Idh/MocA family oxidoreductase [Gemmataceae bacterium]|jgi:predicted dehydrogenase|nr:Gfo/Idh/MocA family oxidoreductase [Gemmataceae bacterium]
MSSESLVAPTRRDAITGGIAVASTLGIGLSGLYAGESNTINIALVGCGGRGTGAAMNALATQQGPVSLVAMADAYEDRLKGSFNQIAGNKRLKDNVAVTDDRKFVGFDAYKKAVDCLKTGDVLILATPPAFRWPHFTYAIEKGVNVFMEKPVCVDGPTAKRMFALGEDSVKKGMKVGVGLMCRHCEARGEMAKRIRDGAIGDITLMRAYRLAGPTGNMPVPKKPEKINELEYQIRHFHGFLWASGGAYSDFLIHNIDECCWIKDQWPTTAKSNGGRHYREGWVDQNFDTYTTEFTFPDGTKLFMEGRTIAGCHSEFASYCHGTKGSGVISESGHWPSHARLFKSQQQVEKDILWEFGEERNNPYQDEWEHLMKAIRQDKPYNEVKRGVEASLVTAMGRMSAHTGKIITRDMILNGGQEFAPNVDKMVVGGEAPVKADAKGMYPLPMPGQKTKTEY